MAYRNYIHPVRRRSFFVSPFFSFWVILFLYCQIVSLFLSLAWIHILLTAGLFSFPHSQMELVYDQPKTSCAHLIRHGFDWFRRSQWHTRAHRAYKKNQAFSFFSFLLASISVGIRESRPDVLGQQKQEETYQDSGGGSLWKGQNTHRVPNLLYCRRLLWLARVRLTNKEGDGGNSQDGHSPNLSLGKTKRTRNMCVHCK